MHERLDEEVCLNGHTQGRCTVTLLDWSLPREGDLFGLTREPLRPDQRPTNLLRGTNWFWMAASGRSACHVRPRLTQSCHSLLAIEFMCPLR